MGNYKYILKTSIPATRVDETIEETIEKTIEKTYKFCLENKIDEVICCIDFENSTLLPNKTSNATGEAINATGEAINATGEAILHLAKCREVFKTQGLGFSINSIFGSMNQDISDLDNCPFSDKWIERVCSFYSDLASVHPDVLWIGEDFRMFDENKQRFWFFCEEFLCKFSKIIGENVSKDDLIATITAPSKAHPWREVWIKM